MTNRTRSDAEDEMRRWVTENVTHRRHGSDAIRPLRSSLVDEEEDRNGSAT